jgi:hypothetical protein
MLLLCGLCLLDEVRITIPTRFESINFAAQPCLPAIDAAGIQEDRTAHLAVRLIALRLF